MRKVVFHSVRFCGVAIAIYVVILFLLSFTDTTFIVKNIAYNTSKYASGHLLTRLREADTTRSADIVVIGSSHAYRGFDPAIFAEYNIRMFNLGSSSQTPVQSEILARKYIEQMKPELVIYECSPDLFSNDGTESAADFISNSEITSDMVSMSFYLNNVTVYNTLLFTFFKRLHSPLSEKKEAEILENDSYCKGGFVRKSANLTTAPYTGKSYSYLLKKNQKTAFENLLIYLEKKDIDVLLVQAPVQKSYYLKNTNSVYFDEYFSAKGTYVNCNLAYGPTLSDSLHFYDNHHLNQEGVKIFNRFIIEKFLK